MRFKHFKPSNLTEQQLDELRMNPTTLNQFANSEEAKGIMAGFEAELVFTGLGGEPEYDEDPEPDMDADERCRTIQQVMDFFENDEYGYGVYGREADKLQEGLDEMYYEWHDEQMYEAFRDEQDELIRNLWLEEQSWEDRVHAVLVDGMELTDEQADKIIELGEARKNGKGKPGGEYTEEELEMLSIYSEATSDADAILDEEVEQSIAKQDKHYDYALDEFRDGFFIDDDSGFFSDVGLRWMSDVRDQFDLMWPVMTYTGSSSEGGFSVDNAERLADDLHEKLGVKTKVSSGYHSARRDNETWIFEPDSSLDADDSDNMPVEIVSPPMPLETCLKQMENFFTWAESNGAYANSSTGFHMGVSLPHRGGDVDYVKLALFLGDEHVLREFGRSGNHFCEAAMKKIKNRVKGNKEAVAGALDLMKHNLIELAQKALEINNHGFGKYTSINPQGGNDNTNPAKEKGAKYIEFRSAGGSNYFEDIDKLKNTLLRYAQAMTIAANPAAERREYYKKLYKLISPPEGDPAIDLFARFATGAISSEELKKTWADKQLEKEPKGDWKLWDANGKAVPGEEFHGYTKADAWERAKKGISPGGSMEGFQKEYKLLPLKSQTGDWEVYRVDNGETLETLHGFATKGEAADAVYDKYSEQGIAFNLRPADPEQPERELSRREKLAKTIKAPKPTWNVVYRPTGRVIDKIINVSREEAQKLLPKVAQQHQFDSTDDLELHNEADALRAEQPPQSQQDNSRLLDQPPEGFLTQQPSTGEYYEVRGGNDRVYGYISGDAGRAPGGMGLAQTARQYVNNLTGTTGSYIQYREGNPAPETTNPNPTIQEPNQVRMPNGVPVWELFDRMSGTVLHAIADHTMREAHQEAMAWLRSYGAEDPATYNERFGVRPKMLQAGEQNQSRTIAESVFADFDNYFESVVAPVVKRLK